MRRHEISRRQFIAGTTASAAAFTIVPRHVLGGTGFQAPGAQQPAVSDHAPP